MSDVEKKVLEFNIISLGRLKAEFLRINAPSTIQKIMATLPLKGRGTKQGSRLIMPTDISTRPENPKQEFKRGDISMNPKNGNMTIHLSDNQLDTKENYLGSFVEDFSIDGLTMSSGIVIKEAVPY